MWPLVPVLQKKTCTRRHIRIWAFIVAAAQKELGILIWPLVQVWAKTWHLALVQEPVPQSAVVVLVVTPVASPRTALAELNGVEALPRRESPSQLADPQAPAPP